MNESKLHMMSAFCRYAAHVSIGNEVLILENDHLTPSKVVNISILSLQGDFLFFLLAVFCDNVLPHFQQ